MELSVTILEYDIHLCLEQLPINGISFSAVCHLIVDRFIEDFGVSGSENVGLSNANIDGNPMPRKPKGSSARFKEQRFF
ncbi:hypothetical protein R6Q59_029196 [Mikania micrantha]